jgi:hypothetical protein
MVEVAPQWNLLIHESVPRFFVSVVEILVRERLVLGLRRPKVEHAADNVEWISNTANNFRRFDQLVDAHRVVCFNDPHIFSSDSFSWKPRVLKWVVQCSIQVSITACESLS